MTEYLPFEMSWKRGMLISVVLLITVFIPLGASAQSIVKGTVKGADDGELLPGVSILVKGTTRGTITDSQGNYQLEVSNNETLEFSFVGYKTQTVAVAGRSVIDIALEFDVQTLEQVVVVGYGQTSKKEVTGAVAKVEAETLLKNATPDVATALQGQIAGVSVQASSGEPGAAANIRIRGIGSTTDFQGSSDPLYVIDGIPWPLGINPNLSPNEIESIDVLKDASSAAVYGVKGASGVILITTKTGKAGTFRINVDSWTGIQRITSGTSLMSPEEELYTDFMRTFNTDATGERTWSTTFHPLEINRLGFTNNSDLIGIIENDNALTMNHSINVSGGEGNLTYNIVGSYFYQDGVIINSDYGRYNLRSNTTFRKNNWTIKTGVGLRREDRRYAPFGFLTDAIRFSPLGAQIDPNAPIVQDASGGNVNDMQAVGIIASKLRRDDTSDENHLNGFIQIENQVTDNLKLSTRLGASTTDLTRTTIFPLFQQVNQETGELVPQDNSTRSRVQNMSRTQTTWAWESIVDYRLRFNDHRIDFTGVFSLDNVTFGQFQALRFDLINNDVTVLDAATDEAARVDSWSNNPFLRNRVTNTVGIMGRVKYTFKEGRYVVSAVVRRDGSSRFGAENQWLTSPSISAAWNISEEPFWGTIRNVVSSFKLRGGWARIGNQAIPDYGAQPTVAAGQDYVFNTSDSEVLGIGFTQLGFANPNVQWETKTEINAGIDVGLLDNKILVEANVYQDERSDLLALLTPPGSAGSTVNITRNVGDMTNRGIELALNYRHRGQVSWSVGANFSRNINEVTSLPRPRGTVEFFSNSQAVTGVGIPNELNVTGLQVGRPAGSYFLYQTVGVIKDTTTLSAYQEILDEGETARLGDMMYADVNGDGQLTVEDRVYSGSAIPDFEIGLNFDVSYKGFDFSMQWFGAFGGKVMNGSRAMAYKMGRHTELLHAWTPRNPDSDIPADRGRDHPNYWGFTDFWLEDASFVRLRNASIGYTLPTTAIEKIGLDRLRFYISAQNAVTITGYTGYDPEIGNNGLTTRGLDRGTYPISATYRAGLELGF